MDRLLDRWRRRRLAIVGLSLVLLCAVPLQLPGSRAAPPSDVDGSPLNLAT